nr:unnamed protein product [Callosobruchus analis]
MNVKCTFKCFAMPQTNSDLILKHHNLAVFLSPWNVCDLKHDHESLTVACVVLQTKVPGLPFRWRKFER